MSDEPSAGDVPASGSQETGDLIDESDSSQDGKSICKLEQLFFWTDLSFYFKINKQNLRPSPIKSWRRKATTTELQEKYGERNRNER